MKRILFAAAALALATSCISDQSVVITSATLIDEGCVATAGGGKFTLSSGNINAALTTRFNVNVQVNSYVGETHTIVGNDELAGAHRNDVNINQMVLKYTSSPDLGVAMETVPITFRVPSGGSSYFNAVVNMIGPKAAAAIRSHVNAPGQSLQMIVTLQFKGYYASGGLVSSSEMNFPINAYYVPKLTQADCPSGTTLALPVQDVCGNTGQDNAVYTCATPDGGIP